MRRWDASVKVRLVWEGAADPSDDDVGCVVSGPDALLQRVLLDQRGEESAHEGISRPVGVHDIVLVDVQNREHGHLLTDGCNGVVLALGEDHHSLPLCVLLGEVLGLLCDLCNIICLLRK